MKNIFELALQGTLRKKSQTLLVVAVLMISFTLAVMLLSYTSSISATNSAYRASIYGSWYGYIRYGQDGDEKFFSQTEWLNSLGASVNYGTASGYGIGTADENFVAMGITLEEGRMPESSGEIAMEENMLSALNYEYELDQEVTVFSEVTIGSNTVTIPKTYTLVGIIKNYTNLWSVSGATLNSAFITTEDAEELSSDAETTYFFTIKSGYDEESAVTEVNEYLTETRTTSISSYLTVTVNSSLISKRESESDTMSFYIIMVFVVTILAVVIINVLTMQPEVRKTVRLRSLGATKSQLLLLTVYETALMAVPALILGIILGSIGTWLLLTLSMFSGSVSVVVSIPVRKLLLAVLVWIIGTLAVKIATFMVSLTTPLTGRMAMSVKKRKFFVRFQKALIVAMSVVLCSCVVFVTLSVQSPLYYYRYFSSQAPYQIAIASNIAGIDVKSYISDEDIELLTEIPGISKVLGRTQAYVSLTMENVDTRRVEMYAVDGTADWTALDFSGVDLEAFENGDVVMLVFSNSTELPSELPEEGDSVTLSVSNSGVSIETTVAKSMIYKATGGLGINDGLDINEASYYVVCSRAFLQKIVDMLPEGFTWTDYITVPFQKGDTVGFVNAMAYTDSAASYLSTDKTLTRVASSNGLSLIYNVRAKYDAMSQEYLQTLIMLFVSSSCIVVIVLIILFSTIRLETQREKKRYGILQAIGMSKRQRNLELARRAVVRSVIAIVAAVASYLVYYLIMNMSAITAGESAMSVLGTMFTTLATYGLTAPVLIAILAVVFLITFAICFGSKLSLNKYSLMEMLREDR